MLGILAYVFSTSGGILYGVVGVVKGFWFFWGRFLLFLGYFLCFWVFFVRFLVFGGVFWYGCVLVGLVGGRLGGDFFYECYDFFYAWGDFL